MKKKLQIGDEAPDIDLISHSGEKIRLSDFRDKKVTVLYFYPKDDTPGCTTEACAFRDSYEVFKDAGAEVIGVSPDSLESHKRFAWKYELPFNLLSDSDGKLRELYGVQKSLGIPGRVTFIIDKKGIIRHIFSSQMKAKKHVEESLKILKLLDQYDDSIKL